MKTVFKGKKLSQLSLTPSLCVLSLALFASGCSNMLPRVRSESSPFKTFDEARTAIDSLVPMKSDVKRLAMLGIDPVKQPNMTILTHADVVRRFVPSALLKREDLDPGVLACLEARDACRGWEIAAAEISKARTGNFVADFTNFSRRSETTGWRFNALVLLVNEVVVYRAWGGQPNVNEVEVNTNPLGPLQEMGPTLVTNR
ncbi:MAG: hypothetical protein WCH35_05485 [Comamonadaceae bacterium]